MKRIPSPLSVCLVVFLVVGMPTAIVLPARAAPPAKGLATDNSTVVVLDLFNLSAEAKFDSWESLWGRGLRRAVFERKKVQVVPFPRIHSALQELHIDSYYIAPEQVPAIGKKLEADLVVLGSFIVADGVISASLKVVDGKTGRLLREETRFGNETEPEAFMGEMTGTLLKMLFGEETPPTPVPLPTEAPTPEPTPTTVPPPPPPPAPSGEGSSTSALPFSGEIPLDRSTAPVESAMNRAWQRTQMSPRGLAPESPAVAQPFAAPRAEALPPGPTEDAVLAPIEAEIPALPSAGTSRDFSPQSPFQPMPVIPAPPPPRRPMPSAPMGPGLPGGVSPQFGAAPQPQFQQGMQPPMQQPIPQQQPQESGWRRFWSAVSRPFRPAPSVTAPQQPQSPQPFPQASSQPPAGNLQPPPAPLPTPPESGNAVTRFFRRVFGRNQSSN